jgi:hypothetical protein
MNQPTDDRDRARIKAFWSKIEAGLRTHTCFSAVRRLRLTNREGFYLAGAAMVLLALVALVSCRDVSNHVAYLIALPVVYYVAHKGVHQAYASQNQRSVAGKFCAKS